MTDEPLTPSAELASAAFDGETTAAERAVVAASIPLGDEVSFYGDLRERMADVAVPDAARESALAAALAVFDQIQTGTEDLDVADPGPDRSRDDTTWTDARSAVSPTPDTPRIAAVVSLQQRRSRQMRWLGGAVAAAFVGVFAVAAINGRSGSDDRAASSATDSVVSSVSATDQAAKSAPAPEPAMVSQSGDSMAGDAVDSDAQDSTVQDSTAQDSTGQDSTGQDSASGGAEESFSEAANDPSALYALASKAVLGSDDDVRSFVASNEFSDSSLSSTGAATTAAPTTTTATADTTAVAAPLDTTAASTAQSTATTAPASTPGAFALGRACVSDSPGRSAPALYRGAPVFVLVDPANTTATIIDATTCVVIATLDV